ncbi:bifunctional [glutamine synthetase] adenylyltransferase/[glutamine synthetase]-adenylyl-L-tyrosine phosphorylase [Pseudoroseomonas wenyumeiae]|uniref:Bifunctional glutamine synthetase adenylyltransferase/adenylyl-removing enzyme n=1 Tax=Teichococcus wenyumeiae TaxID=2478470 RepID=A0A3A9JVY2_9PROT|nr:bifunctional [glutamine synthetase] adenylyltransferase/[glutamine synthetase]-adenylyl-L-tyrosine phosphorylase [Pseudoroseomonas wenyumeiae]RKK03179.1 bifunctional [glutamine synthetase] adenylyltransferase/[glutamine synthetase]-adenylyl-L-tyrosine phosphorylase [Pseudoroseomonas wenyumeiae]RMI26115.1 bifunctional [glutamine synthetase] adenylyltransferase/[glutamine synthetase]-adenylyl-L-tyrosine phosphorylase [Pseudoroseomonas wenyumeiae]
MPDDASEFSCLPPPFDREAAARCIEGFAARGPAERRFAETARGVALLGALAGHSPYLAGLAERESATLLRFAERGADAALELALDPLSRADPDAARPAVAALLRQAKRQAALIIALADLSGQWPLDRVTGALSTLAEATIDYACAHLLREAANRGELRLPRAATRDPRLVSKGSGLIVLGMGKLGARELNYSSDIDLMVLYDPEAAAYHTERAGAVYVRIARDLVRLMEERTADGYVFRTDLRLRPDPAATPLAVSIHTAILYYESMGQNWERAAMIKARPVGGDRAAGDSFLAEIRPFVWRRHLDFAMMADIHAIKRQIHAAHSGRGAHKEVRVAGHNVKLGRGGIREVEFTVQALQLIWAGRDPGLRDPTTLGALAALAAAGRIERRAAADLADAYVFLRDVEHRLQMVDDRQTQQLPEDDEALARIASFMGFNDTASFATTLTRHLSRVEKHYSELFEHGAPLPDMPPQEASDHRLHFEEEQDDPETLSALGAMGFTDPAKVSARFRSWLHGQTRATRSERARALLRGLTPPILAAFASQREPDVALARFDTVLSRLQAGVQVLSLFQRNPALLSRVAGILGAAPALADHLALSPASLEGLLAGQMLDGASTSLPALVKDARHMEEALEDARRLVTEGKFEIDAAALEGRIDADEAGIARSDLADAAIGALLPHVAGDFTRRFGKLRGGALAVVALGKLGGREMLPGSDLDLVLVYDHPEDVSESTGGPRALPPSTYFARLAQQMVAAITAPGAEGKLYEVDMRLRPSGSKGPVATSLSAFERYHAESAWTWERMALTRARCVAGPPGLRRRIGAAVKAALIEHAGPQAVADAVAMRTRMLRDLPPEGPLDIKAMPGGLVEVEFIAQALQLAHARMKPGILAPTTRVALQNLGRAKILPPEDAEALIAADRLWRTTLGLLRLTVGRWKGGTLPAATAIALQRATAPLLDRPAVDLSDFQAQMQARAQQVRSLFERHLGRLDSGGTA